MTHVDFGFVLFACKMGLPPDASMPEVWFYSFSSACIGIVYLRLQTFASIRFRLVSVSSFTTCSAPSLQGYVSLCQANALESLRLG
ncbi:hypothetical protein EMPG_10581 [Blastomyces silverae]|uniref:Uncharacterized protein n=1 Tax=Blastomyces silverae TaxID=2060906 RepID=A0A0H1B4G8_9EURO|nr:hypothetical protein EMPG_10581 [Blastomyces silverae]